jgi:hypothetical protein
LFAAVENRDRHAVHGAVERFMVELLEAELERGIPRMIERLPDEPGAQAISGLARHADRLRRNRHRRGFDERFEKTDHAFARPAVVAGGVGGCGDDGRRGRTFGGRVCHLAVCNQMGLCRKGGLRQQSRQLSLTPAY